VSLLEDSQNDEPKDALVKHNVSREMATAYLNAGNLDKALQYAQTDLSMRPENIDANELVAWIYYLKGDYTNAKVHADKMMATKTQNAGSLYKAGVIYSGAGAVAQGSDYVKNALAINPFIDQRLISQTKSPVTLTKG
jgi:tetratricopeptide (TPR) repeat protein